MNGVVSTHITDMIARAVSLDVLERQLGRKPAGDENHAQSKTWHLCCNTRVHGATLANHSVLATTPSPTQIFAPAAGCLV